MKKTMRTILALLLSLCLLSTLLPVTTLAAEGNGGTKDAVSYLDANGAEQSCTDYTVVSADLTSWTAGWYVVNQNVTVTSRINVTGDVRLILCSGAAFYPEGGITVSGGNSLTIFGQSGNSGRLEVAYGKGQSLCAAIGGLENGTTGDITINGGTIKLDGWNSAAIGSGANGTPGSITINGGSVTATGGYYSAGIGGGYGSGCGTVTINGGTIAANGGYACPGIGGGYYFSGSIEYSADDLIIRINGGQVTAKAGYDGNYAIGSYADAPGARIQLGWNKTSDYISYVKYNGSDVGAIHAENDQVTLNADFRISETTVYSAGVIQTSALTATPLLPVLNMSYLDENGTSHSIPDLTYHKLSASDTTITGWVAAADDLNLGGTRLAVSGDTCLVLRDGVTLTVPKGITVPDGSSLTIYAQSTGEVMGALTITQPDKFQAGIGCGTHHVTCGQVTINGGRITTVGGQFGAGIGCATGGTVTAITVNGGDVTATGGHLGAGIGGGSAAPGGSLTINGGKVTAGGGDEAAGIGGGYAESGGIIVINGGEITASGGVNGGAGIGGAKQGNGGSITINDGKVTAAGGDEAAGIGGGYEESGGIIVINGGEITAFGGVKGGAGIGGAKKGNGGSITINDGTVIAQGGTRAAGIGGGLTTESGSGCGGDIAIHGGSVTAIGGSTASGIGGGGTDVQSGGCGGTFVITGGQVTATTVEGGVGIGCGSNSNNGGAMTLCLTGADDFLQASSYRCSITVEDPSDPSRLVYIRDEQNIPYTGALTNYQISAVAGQKLTPYVMTYLDEDGEIQTLAQGDFAYYTGPDVPLTGWVAVMDNVDVGSTRLTVAGQAHLILCNGATLTVPKGITVPDFCSLTIYAQSTGEVMGALSITQPDNFHAGIGCETYSTVCGQITINGGRITTVGGKFSAGIGCATSGSVPGITVNGGNVTATGGYLGAGIGGGANAAGGILSFNGGKVTATGGEEAAGIGGGSGSSGQGGSVCIRGGEITAAGVSGGAGIGGGRNGNGGTVVITGGQVTATSAYAGIGGGFQSSGGGALTLCLTQFGDYLKASSYTGSVTVADPDDADRTVYVRDETGTFYTGVLSDSQKQAAAGQKLTVPDTEIWVVDQTNSDSFYAYVYNAAADANDGTAWPGHPLTLLGKDFQDNNYYSFRIDTTKYDVVIFNDGAGAQNSNQNALYLEGLTDPKLAIYNNSQWMTFTGEDIWVGEGVITTEPGCVTDGERTWTGIVHGTPLTEPVGALGHDYVDVVTEPTATEQGYTTHTCSRCGDTYVDSYTDPTGPVEPIETSNLHIYSSISVGTDMVITFTARKNDLTNYNTFWIEVVKHEPDGDVTCTYGQDVLTENSSTWVAQFKHIFAKEMGVNVEARLYAQDDDGQIFMSPARSTNIRDYLGGRLTATTNKVEQRVLAADMLNYGAAAQMFTGFQTDHLVNEELTEAQLAKLHEYETTTLPAVNKTNSNYRPEGASNILFNSVTLGNEVVLNLTVRLTQGTENVQVLVKDHATGEIVTTLDTSWSGSSIQAAFNGIGADKMRTEFDFVTLVNGVETGNIRTWSVEAYVGEIRAGTLPLKTAMANALLTYGDSAAAYFAAQ